MRIEGIKGCYEKTLGMFYFGRMCSKVWLHASGKLPSDYFDMLGQGFDGRTCRYLGVTYEDIKREVLSGKSDTEVLEWCFAKGGRLTAEEILIYNSFMSKRGWRDDETDGFIPAMIKEYGVKDDGSVITDFDLIEMDEGRWYPEMWRDAWK
jgi:gluconokinase